MRKFLRNSSEHSKGRIVEQLFNYVMLSMLLIVLTGCATANLALLPKTENNFPKLNRKIQEMFADVQHISTDELSHLLSKLDPPEILLLDVREREEYDVSHLSSAIHLAPNANFDYLGSRVTKDHMVVTYCAVGYRSAIMARNLQKEGYTNVRNLEGSLFAWVNEGRRVYQGKKPVTKTHPYNKRWGKLLKEHYRASITK